MPGERRAREVLEVELGRVGEHQHLEVVLVDEEHVLHEPLVGDEQRVPAARAAPLEHDALVLELGQRAGSRARPARPVSPSTFAAQRSESSLPVLEVVTGAAGELGQTRCLLGRARERHVAEVEAAVEDPAGGALGAGDREDPSDDRGHRHHVRLVHDRVERVLDVRPVHAVPVPELRPPPSPRSPGEQQVRRVHLLPALGPRRASPRRAAAAGGGLRRCVTISSPVVGRGARGRRAGSSRVPYRTARVAFKPIVRRYDGPSGAPAQARRAGRRRRTRVARTGGLDRVPIRRRPFRGPRAPIAPAARGRSSTIWTRSSDDRT